MYHTKPRISEARLMTAGEGPPQLGPRERANAAGLNVMTHRQLETELGFLLVHMLLGLEKKAFTSWGFLLKRFSDVIMTPTT